MANKTEVVTNSFFHFQGALKSNCRRHRDFSARQGPANCVFL